jgi:radical SAM superfamily enzyme YgiQ (UPF0313 family)
MKIALISPKGSSWSNNKYFRQYWHNNPDAASYRNYWTGLGTGLLVVAAMTPEHHKIELVDENVEPVDFNKAYDLIGISVMTQQATRAYEIADEWRKRKAKVIMGGIHPTVLPDEAKRHADSVVIGEVEYLWRRILDDMENSRLRDFYRADSLVDMRDSPVPRFDLLDPKKYLLVWIQTSRGCPHDCDFCAASKVYGRKYREKMDDQILQEIEHAKSVFPNVRYYFADDNFFVNRNSRKRLLERLAPLKIRWMAQTDVSIAEHDDLLESAYRSGCVFLFIGFESLSAANLRSIDKDQWKYSRLERYPEYIRKIQSFGIGVQGAFIVGFDGDDGAVFDTITDFILGNNLYGAQISVLTPFPGTKLRERLEHEGRITCSHWQNYSGFDVNYIPEQITKEELERGVVRIYQRITERDFFLKNMEHFKRIHKTLQNRYK